MVRAPVVSVIVNYITAGEKCCTVKYGYDAMTVSGGQAKTSRNNYYPMVKRRVKHHECCSTRVFSSLFINEDYGLAHSYTLQET